MLNGKNAIITGSNRGIGRAIVEEFARCGCNIWACARKENHEFEEQLALLSEKHGVWIKPVYFDLSSEEAVKDGFKQIHGEKLPVDILVNNAAMGYSGMFSLTPMQVVRKLYEVNVFSVFALTQLVLKKMIRQKSGSIVNLASVAGLEAHHGDVTYGSSKAAIISLTQNLAAEMAEFGIRVNAVAPGPTETEMIVQFAETAKGRILDNVAMGRMAQPEEIARVVCFLASEGASFVNGQVLKIDGGKR